MTSVELKQLLASDETTRKCDDLVSVKRSMNFRKQEKHGCIISNVLISANVCVFVCVCVCVCVCARVCAFVIRVNRGG